MFVEPQFVPKLMETLLEESDAKVATLDPVGIKEDSGLGGYSNMIWKLAETMRMCLE